MARTFFYLICYTADVIRAVAYINARWGDQDMWDSPYLQKCWGDYRVQVNDGVLDRWKIERLKDRCLQANDELFDQLKP